MKDRNTDMLRGGLLPGVKLRPDGLDISDKAIEKYPKDQELKNIRKHIDLYNKFYINKKLNFTKDELCHIEINDLLYLYFAEQNHESSRAQELKKKIVKETDKLENVKNSSCRLWTSMN